MRFISVDLPEPERTHDGEVVAGIDLEIDTVKGADLDRSHVIDLAQLSYGNHLSRPGPRRCPTLRHRRRRLSSFLRPERRRRS